MTKKFSKLLGLALGLVGLLGLGLYALIATAQVVGPVQLSARVVGQPLAAGNYLFWAEAHGLKIALHAFNQTNQTNLVIADSITTKSSLASDGQQLAWVEAKPDGSQASIEAYNLTNAQITTLVVPQADNQFGGLALANHNLYYNSAQPGHSGLFALNLITRQEQLLSATGQNPVASQGWVAWSEEKYQGQYRPGLWSLYLKKTASGPNQSASTQLAQATGQFEVAINSESLVWSARQPATDRRAYRYSFAQSRVEAISTGEARQPATVDSKVAWVVPPATDSAQTARWSVEVLDTKNKGVNRLVNPGSARLDLVGFVGSNNLAFMVGQADPAGGANTLYLTRLDNSPGSNPTFDNPPTKNVKPSVTNPLNCGQVYQSGYQLYDCNGRWTVNGVQFILPERGINGQSFWDANYQASVASGQVDYWLDQAAVYLQPAMLRVFVDMPGDTGPVPTSPATLYDLASRAASRRMRLGLVLHNDTSWTLYPARKQWLSDLITYFRARNALPLLAYLSADNEINNHCGVGTPDCYDNNPDYVNKANGWVANFTTYVRSLNAGILLTVGTSSEKSSSDAQPTVYDFFRTAGNAPGMAASVDFLAPHNYQGGGYSLWPTMRYNLGYSGPIVLEEYGYSTDLLSQNPYFTEGPPLCRSNPFDQTCLNTAPYFVEVNLRAQRENWTNGFAGGSAWMLADLNRKDCTSPGDFYTGLLAAGDYPRCNANGTTTTTTGTLKATGARVRFQYTGTTDLPLAAPTNLVASPTNPIEINLSWTDNSNSETGYVIERRPASPTNWVTVAYVAPNVTTYRDRGLVPGGSYVYRLRAIGPNEAFSAYSNESNATTPTTFDYTIQLGQDDGSKAAGTLSEALSVATSGQYILLAPPGNLLTITGPLPAVPDNVVIAGNCSNGPGVRVQAGTGAIPGLNLKGKGATLYGLAFSGFGGPQLKLSGNANWLGCVKVGS